MAPQTIAVLNGTSRTFKHLIPQALGKGHKVRAVVRSASRFLAQTKKHDDLSVHEWSDFSDLTTLATILDGVDVVYLAYGAAGKALLEPFWLNEDAAVSIGTVLRGAVAPGSRSPVKLVILVSYVTRPDEARHAFAEILIGNQFNDLRAAQDYLTKQSSWLDVVFISPGPLTDSETSDDPTRLQAVRLLDGGAAQGPISYARLASAMQLAAEDPKWVGKYALPVATTKIAWKLKHLESRIETLQAYARYKLLPALMYAVMYAAAGWGWGYVVGVRDGGELLRRYGLNIRA